ncbi:hypothetical protein CORT_0C01980 [Candida orthopsilosis Co 90-125]|uniref:2-dehydropantolactone reductase n=1 Tax=Candida orthopsilosis (strain 90-125) TaxID=1136231 RepID=H8X2M7_CANO9|nr:hypothetical protein CORT_0C01980 [Candida orthopsilosis Co 90-125]CCG25574.1 hypothetical protein CORT_0C01980 [Candida orthopsilosis Co 90-125]
MVNSSNLNKYSTSRLSNGQTVPIAGFGTYLIPAEKVTKLVYDALAAGYRHIDTAIAYKNQREVAQGVSKFLKDHLNVQRSDIWFTTKIAEKNQGYENTRKAVQQISDETKEFIDYVDLILVHSPKTSTKERLGTYEALQEYVLNPDNETLNVRSIGVSNYGVAHLEELFHWENLKVKPVINQLELHPWLPRVELRNYMEEHNILTEAYSPLTRGRKSDDPELLELSQKYNLSPAEILLKWSYLQGFIVLVKTENPKRIKENLDILPDYRSDSGDESGKLELNSEILRVLNKPDSKIVLTWGGVDPTLYKDE